MHHAPTLDFKRANVNGSDRPEVDRHSERATAIDTIIVVCDFNYFSPPKDNTENVFCMCFYSEKIIFVCSKKKTYKNVVYTFYS